MILSFADETTRMLTEARPLRRVPTDLARQAYKRLAYLAAARRLEDLYQPPSNDFHALSGTGRYAIRVNLQWRITFHWTDQGPMPLRLSTVH